MKLFGTDGIRGRANHYPITPEVACRLGVLVGELFPGPEGRARVLIGRDTRLSGPMLEAALAAGLLSAGAEVIPLGVVPTPAVATLARSLSATAGIVLSASHNPYEDNGIKIFQASGYKCDDALEARIEAALLSPEPPAAPRPDGAALGRVNPRGDAADLYVKAVLASWPAGLSLAGTRIVVDAANGAAFQTTPAALRALGAEVLVFHDRPDGVNINAGCGSTHPEVVEALVREHKADFGLSHDGDADRLIACDETGAALDGDEVLAVVGLHLLRAGALDGGGIAATVMSNLALDELFAAHGAAVHRSAVGDRAVLELMREKGLVLGGEPSGHMICAAHATTGDGLLSALQLLRVMRETGKPLSALRAVLKKYPQLLVNVKVRERVPFSDLPEVGAALAAVEAEMGAQGRAFLRYSGTEPKVRLLLEAKEGERLPVLAEKILGPLKKAIGA
ncbi:MAG: phosphoglucosamine mutase [Verrucomicrobium sp.]|nr:phosphoglucosamine mutase [Verrucomicrobium sp.]